MKILRSILNDTKQKILEKPILKHIIVRFLIKFNLLGLAIRYFSTNSIVLQKYNDENPMYILGNKLMSKAEWYRRYNSYLKNFPPLTPKKIDANEIDSNHLQMIVKDESKPSISVLISLYDADKYLDYLLSGLAAQTICHKTEFIFILVKPSQKTLTAISNFMIKYKLSKLIEFENLVGIYEAWNAGIKIAQSDFLTNWNADDCRAPNSLESQYKWLTKNDWIDVIYQDVFYSLEPNLEWGMYEMIGMESNLCNVSAQYLLGTGMNPPHNAPAWRKSLHKKHGLFDESFKSAGDYEFWIRISLNDASFFKAPLTNVGYFLNPRGLSTKIGGQGLQETLRIRRKYLPVLKTQTQNAIRKNGKIFKIDNFDSADQITEKFLDSLK